MNKKGAKYKIILFFLFIFLFPSNLSWAASNCSPNGYEILTVNGVFTNEAKANINKNNLKDLLPPTYNNQPLTVDYLLNPSHLAGVGDVLAAAYQKYFDEREVRDYDLVEMLRDASEKVKTQKLLLVAHSQGNFYANSFYDTILRNAGSDYQSIGVYGVASPASRVAGGGRYLTSDTDQVIEKLRTGGVLSILPANTRIGLPPGDAGNGHSFSDVYLKYKGSQIIGEIQGSLNVLQNNKTQDPTQPCFLPPELSVGHKIAGAMFAVADPSAQAVKSGAVGAYKAGVYIADGAQKIGGAIGDGLHSAGLALGGVFKNLPANVAGSLPENQSSLSTILPGMLKSLPEQKDSEPAPVPDITAAPSSPDGSAPILSNLPDTPDVSPNNPAPTDNTQPGSLQTPSYSGGSYTGGGGGAPTPEPEEPGTLTPATDTTEPVITISGDNPASINLNEVYTDLGATALDDIDGEVVVTPSGEVDTSVAGAYIITYTATDLAGNVATATRTVNVVIPEAPESPPGLVVADTTPPVINILGDNPAVIRLNSPYTDAGATALDDIDGAREVATTGVDTVNTAALGVYTITYTATDLSLNTSIQTRAVVMDNGAMLNRPAAVAVSGNYAYVVSELSNSMEIIDIANPAAPVHKGFAVNGMNGFALSNPKAIVVSGNYAYVVSYGNTLEIIDISNPVLPIHKSTLFDGDGGANLRCPLDIAVAGNYAYIAASGCGNGNPGVITIINISDPLNPVYQSFYYNPSLTWPSAVFVSGNYMYATLSYILGGGSGVLHIVDISNPSLPVFKGSLEHTVGGASINGSQSVFVSGNYVYITSRADRTFEIVDVTDPANPIHKGKLAEGVAGAAPFTLISAVVSGNYAYVVSFNGSTLEVIDISDPANSIHTGTLTNGAGGAKLLYPTSIVVSGNEAYIASSFDNTMEIVDISDPANPRHKSYLRNGDFVYTPPVLSSAKAITRFNFTSLTPAVVGVINDTNHEIGLSVPFGTNITSLAPLILVSYVATVSPSTGVAQDFSNPVNYTVTAQDGSTQNYTVTVTIEPDPNPVPDTTLPVITSYTFDGVAQNITVDPSTGGSLAIVLNASENVDWVSIQIENSENASQDKTFFSDSSGCVDDTNTCAKTWDLELSGGAVPPDGIYRIKAHIEDAAGNEFWDYLSPYTITVATTVVP